MRPELGPRRAPFKTPYAGRLLTGDKLGTHQAVEYLIRVVLGIPIDGSETGHEFDPGTKKEIQDLVVIGFGQGHVDSSSSGIRDAARLAVNDTFKKLKFSVRKQ